MIGFDNREEVATNLRPALTTGALSYREMGGRAVEHLVAGSTRTALEALPRPLVPQASA